MNRALTVVDRIVAVADRDGFRAHGVHVRIGDDAAQFHWDADVPRDVHSVAKGVCVLAAGIAADAGIFDLDAPVTDYFPDFTLGEDVHTVTTRHLLGMRSGVDLPWSPTLLTDWPDLAREFVRRPSRGRVFQYSNASTYTAMRALGVVVGDVLEWVSPRLFAPLGIPAPVWDRCPGGWIAAGEGLHLRVSELARVGQLIRDGGVWRDDRLVSSTWVEALHSDWFDRDAGPGYTRYALAGWAGPGRAWRLHGAYGQLLIFLDDAVVTIAADDHAGADRMADQVVRALEA